MQMFFYVKKGRIYVFYPGGLNFDVNVQTTINNLLPTKVVEIYAKCPNIA